MKTLMSLLLSTLLCSSVYAHNHEEKFDMMDTDNDGKISQSEHETGAAEMFGKVDKNGDNRITAEEMNAKVNDKMKQGKNPHWTAAEKMWKADANADKVVTLEEFKMKWTAKFKDMDTNKDGFLTAEEKKAGYDRKMKK